MSTLRSLWNPPGPPPRVSPDVQPLDHEVSGIRWTESADPTDEVAAGRLLVTGMRWWREPHAAVADRFAAVLAAGGAAGVAVYANGPGAPSAPAIRALTEAAVRHRIPVLEIPPELSFTELTARASADGEDRRPWGAIDLPALFSRVAAELAAPCWVLSATGRIVIGTEPAPREAPHWPGAFADAGRLPTTVGGYTLLPIPAHPGDRPGSADPVPWLLAAAGGTSGSPSNTALTGLAEARRAQLRALSGPHAAVLLRQAVGESAGAREFAMTLAAAKLDPNTPARVIMLRANGSLAVDLLAELLPAVPELGVLGEVTGGACVILTGGSWPAGWVRDTRDRLATAAPFLGSSPVFAGLGGPVPLADLRVGGAQALAAAHPETVSGQRFQVTAAEDLPTHRLLVASASETLRRSLRARSLTPLLDYDTAQRTELVPTVRTYLRCSASPALTARKLHIHVNTVRYRISRASEVLGVDLTEFENQVEVFLALSAGEAGETTDPLPYNGSG